MTGDVAFSDRLLPLAVWLWWSNRTQASAEENTRNLLKVHIKVTSEVTEAHVLPSLTGVPRVVAVRPRQLGLETVGQVEESPGQNDDVVHTAMKDDHLAGITETCRQRGLNTSKSPMSRR